MHIDFYGGYIGLYRDIQGLGFSKLRVPLFWLQGIYRVIYRHVGFRVSQKYGYHFRVLLFMESTISRQLHDL